jgi:hypothetical protein
MAETAYDFSIEEAKNFLLASVVVAAGFIALDRIYEPVHMLKYILLAPLLLGMREFGQRFTAQRMQAYVETEFSQEGSIFSLGIAIFAVIIDLPLILLLPIYNEFDNREYESWGYQIDVIWSKREYWIASVGLLAVMVLWPVFMLLGLNNMATAVGIFTALQLIPLKESNIMEGTTDGAYIILHSGFVWTMYLGISIVMAALPL